MRSGPEAPAESTRRLFFALWPDQDAGRQLEQITNRLGRRIAARWVRPDNQHVTLAFLGAVPESRLPCLKSLELRAGGFELVLDSLCFRRRRRMIWIEPDAPVGPLNSLVALLEAELDREGIARDARPFRAHLTLGRQVRDADPELPVIEPVTWKVRSIVLVESAVKRSGVCYRPVHGWALQTTPKGISVE